MIIDMYGSENQFDEYLQIASNNNESLLEGTENAQPVCRIQYHGPEGAGYFPVILTTRNVDYVQVHSRCRIAVFRSEALFGEIDRRRTQLRQAPTNTSLPESDETLR